MVNVLEAMAKDSWPNGVTSWDDTVKFARLVFGEKVSVEDYSHRLPNASNKSFLLFARGACGPGTPFQEIGELIEPHLEEVKQYELVHRRNAARPEKSQQMLGSDNWTVHYWSTQLTRAPCTCRVRGLQNYGMLHYRRTLNRLVTGGSGPSGWTRCGRQCGTGMTTIKVMA